MSQSESVPPSALRNAQAAASARRTIFPRDHKRTEPLTPAEFKRAKAAEAERKQWDPSYVTREEAEAIPQDALDASPELQRRVNASMHDWPERAVRARDALRDAPTGAGETIDDRSADAAEFMETCGQCVARDGSADS